VVDVDVAPAAGVRVNDLDAGRLAFELADIPGGPVELLAVGAGGGARDAGADEEVDAGLIGMVAAADEEVDVRALDFQLGRGKRACGFVAAGKAVDQSLAAKAANGHLAGECAAGGFVAEGVADRGP
jgi:hypothetical protein